MRRQPFPRLQTSARNDSNIKTAICARHECVAFAPVRPLRAQPQRHHDTKRVSLRLSFQKFVSVAAHYGRAHIHSVSGSRGNDGASSALSSPIIKGAACQQSDRQAAAPHRKWREHCPVAQRWIANAQTEMRRWLAKASKQAGQWTTCRMFSSLKQAWIESQSWIMFWKTTILQKIIYWQIFMMAKNS
jgi:hypothetical protein